MNRECPLPTILTVLTVQTRGMAHHHHTVLKLFFCKSHFDPKVRAAERLEAYKGVSHVACLHVMCLELSPLYLPSNLAWATHPDCVKRGSNLPQWCGSGKATATGSLVCTSSWFSALGRAIQRGQQQCALAL